MAQEFNIVGRSRWGREKIDSAGTRAEADRLRDEYALAFGPEWSLWVEAPVQAKAHEWERANEKTH